MGFHETVDDIDDVSREVVNNGFSYKQKRLNHADMSLYGESQDWDVFSVVTCYSCGMILKPQAFNDHLKKRHNRDSISDDSNSSYDTNFTDQTNSPANTNNSTDKITEPKAKRQKRNHDLNPNTESFPLVQSPSVVLTKAKTKARNFFKPSAHQNVTVQQQRKAEPKIKIKIKLKKSDHGTWTVMAPS